MITLIQVCGVSSAVHVEETLLFTSEEMDQAAQKSEGLRPPGA